MPPQFPKPPKHTHRPRLVTGQVWHARLHPFSHAFRYRAFYLQLPLRSLQRDPCTGRGWGINRRALLSVQDRDHGDGRPLLEWADDILRQAGVHDADGEIWLQTCPRMLGYVFKPVSFWFCERQDGSTAAIIAEVNNTFGDRHVYVLRPSRRPLANGETLKADKAFYVSPFFDLRGHYQSGSIHRPAAHLHERHIIGPHPGQCTARLACLSLALHRHHHPDSLAGPFALAKRGKIQSST